MRSRLGVAHQDDIVLDPALVRDAREIAPQGTVHQQAVSLQLLGEYAFEQLRGLRFVESVETGLVERVRLHFHDPRGTVWFVLIAMRNEDAVLGFPEEKRKRVERA